MTVAKTVKAIQSLKIQGAQAVAKESIIALKNALSATHAKTPQSLLRELEAARKKLISARQTEPCLRNALEKAFHDISYEDLRTLKTSLFVSFQEVLTHLRGVNAQIAGIGSLKIRNGMTIFTHCHSSTVISILKEAKKQGKRFRVNNTETRPKYQGRLTAKELVKAGIPVTHFVDSAARLALKKADLMLIGADAITVEGKVINKIGSELFAHVAHSYDIPVYSCTDSWKFDPKTIYGFEEPIEIRKRTEIWPDAPKEIDIDNHAFEAISPKLITGVITEIGIFSPLVLVEEIQDHYPWMF